MTAAHKTRDEMQFVDDGTGLRAAFAGNVYMSFFYGAPTVERLNFLFEHESRCVAGLSSFSAISVVDPRTGRDMSKEARKRASEISLALKGRMLASVTVVEGAGFFPALVRSVLAGIQIFSDREIVWHVSTSTDDALDFVVALHEKRGAPIVPERARAALARIKTG
jgi:hypothetical protein